MKPNILLYAALAIPEREDTRCCTDEPPVVERPAALRRWSSKLRVAVPSSLRVFRRTVREPLERVPAGTPVRTTAGRDIGRVRDVVVALPSGRASYTVHALRTAGAHAVVEEQVLEGRSDAARNSPRPLAWAGRQPVDAVAWGFRWGSFHYSELRSDMWNRSRVDPAASTSAG